MLLKLYEEGFLDYHALLLKFYKDLELTEVELVVLLKILELYKTTKKIRTAKLVSATNLSKIEVEKILNNLMIKKIYSLGMIENENGVIEEQFSLEPLFKKLEDCFKNQAVLKIEGELKSVIATYEREINRPITSTEYSIIEDFIKKDSFQISELKNAIKEAVKQNKISLSFIEKVLINNRKKLMGDSKSTLDDKTSSDLDKAFQLI